MSAVIGPATAAPQGAEVARPTARPGEPDPRSAEAFAAQLARALNDAPVQSERGARAEPGQEADADADADTSTNEATARDASDAALPTRAEGLAGLAATPPAANAAASAATPIAIPIEALEAAALAAAAAKAKPGGRLPTDPASQRTGPQAADTRATVGAATPHAVGLLPEPAREAATTAVAPAHADAGLRDAVQAAPQTRPAVADASIAGVATTLPGASSLAAAPATVPAAATHAAPPSLPIAAAVDTPAFAPALAQQVSWMVREGLGVASLHLNPPELGSVSVQIVVEGRQARVDFGAEMALTRTAIEDSLPRLASALQEAGLTLSGGGVFDGRPPRDAPEPARERAAPVDEEARPAAPAGVSPSVRTGMRGLVDLVA